MVIDFQWCKSPQEETFSTWKIIQSSKCFLFDFRTLAVSWSTRYASAERAELRDSWTTCTRVETSKARVPRYEPQKRAYLDTNELPRGRTNTRWASNRKLKMNYDARVWVRPRTTTRVELIRCYTGAKWRTALKRGRRLTFQWQIMELTLLKWTLHTSTKTEKRRERKKKP